MDSTQFIQILLWNLFLGRGIIIVAANGSEDDFEINDLFNREDLFDKGSRKLKPVKEVIEDYHIKEFPKISDCGPDQTQNWVEPDSLDCSCYFACDGKFYLHRQCSGGLYYDTKTHSCNWAKDVDCEDRPEPWKIPHYLGPHQIHEQFNIQLYTNMDSSSKLQKPKTESNDEEKWPTLIEDGGDTFYEYDM